MKGKSMRTLGVTLTLASSGVSSQTLHIMPTASSWSKMHVEVNTRAEFMHPSFCPRCVRPEAEQYRDIKTSLGGDLQDGRRVRCGDHMLPTYISEIHLHVEQLLQNTY